MPPVSKHGRQGLDVYPVGSLAKAVGFLSGQVDLDPHSVVEVADTRSPLPAAPGRLGHDQPGLVGHDCARRVHPGGRAEPLPVRVSLNFPQAICGIIVTAILEIALREFAVKSSQTGRICGRIRTPPTPCRTHAYAHGSKICQLLSTHHEDPMIAEFTQQFDHAAVGTMADQHQGQDQLPQPSLGYRQVEADLLGPGFGSTARV